MTDEPDDDAKKLADQVAEDRKWAAGKRKGRKRSVLEGPAVVMPEIAAMVEGAAGDPSGVIVEDVEDPDMMGPRERFAAARLALLDVETPADGTKKAEEMSEAAKRLRGFAWEPGPLGLPPGFPVRPLGKKGGHLYFQNPIDEIVDISASKLSQQGEIDNLLAPDGGFLWGYYAAVSKNGELRIKYEDVRRDLIQACGRIALRQGTFDPVEKVRGRGAWRTDEGVLVLHLGNKLLVGGEPRELGELEGYVYSRDHNLPGPFTKDGALVGWKDDEGGGKAAGRWLLSSLSTWRWRRPDLDPLLVLGWVVCVFMGAAIKWRPQIYPIGDAATGKSSLTRLIKNVLAFRLVDVVDPTGPGIYQTLGMASIGVWVDEFEREGDENADGRSQNVLRLARYASDGKRIVRGGQDGVPSNYNAMGVFGFTGVNPHPLTPAEASRIAMPMLQPFTDASSVAPELTERQGEELGQALLGRIMTRWSQWPEILAAFRTELIKEKQDSRSADQFGTLLAAAHLVCHDGPPLRSQLDKLLGQIGRHELAETANLKPNWERAVDWLLQAQPEPWRGLAMRSVGEYLLSVLEEKNPAGENETKIEAARKRLAMAGMSLVTRLDEADASLIMELAIPNSHPQVGALFKSSSWGTRAGGAEGTWSKILQLAPADVAQPRKGRVDGRPVPCMMLRLDKILSREDPRGAPGEEG